MLGDTIEMPRGTLVIFVPKGRLRRWAAGFAWALITSEGTIRCQGKSRWELVYALDALRVEKPYEPFHPDDLARAREVAKHLREDLTTDGGTR